MDILTQLAEYKTKIEALAGKAAQAETLLAEMESLKAEHETIKADFEAGKVAATLLNEKVTALESENETLKAEISKREEDKKASDEKALEIVASLGLKEIPVITITESNKPTAESIRAKYMAISDPTEKGKFFNENRNAILNGIIE